MSLFEIIASVALFVFSLALIVIVLSQQGKDAYLGGAIAGGAAESFLGKNKARTIETTLTRVTRVIAILVVALTVTVSIATNIKG